MERERLKHGFVVSLIHAFIGGLLYVPFLPGQGKKFKFIFINSEQDI